MQPQRQELFALHLPSNLVQPGTVMPEIPTSYRGAAAVEMRGCVHVKRGKHLTDSIAPHLAANQSQNNAASAVWLAPTMRTKCAKHTSTLGEQNRVSPVVAPSVNKGIVRIPNWICFVMFRRAGSVLVKLLVWDLLDHPVHQFPLPRARALRATI